MFKKIQIRVVYPTLHRRLGVRHISIHQLSVIHQVASASGAGLLIQITLNETDASWGLDH